MPRESRPEPGGERTEEQRARDREERERRRAGRGLQSEGEEEVAVSDRAIAGEPSANEPLPAPLPESTPPAPIHADTLPPPIPPVEPPARAAPRGERVAGAGREVDSSAAALPPAHSRGNRRGRSLMARVGAVIALVVVAGVVWLLARSLLDTGHAKTVTPPVAVKVLIPEGKTRLQIAQIAIAGGLAGSYRQASRHSRLLDPAHYGAPANTPDLEGFLFPATYDMDPHANVQRLVDEQLVTFREHFGASEVRRARELGVTPYELLTVASMIEREAQVPHDRALIAAVIYNRLHEGMPLGIDATIYYAVELQKGIPTYTSELSEAELHIDSPYNTRTHTGLPPTPISNPGQASIEAAAHPAHVSYLYYVAAADGCGEQTFSTSEAAFEQNVAAYKAAVQKNGGKPPACKGR